MCKKYCYLFYVFFITTNVAIGQVIFSETGTSSLGWPFKKSFYISKKDGSNGWELIEGSTYHRQADLAAQDWSITGCVANGNTCGQELLSTFDGKVIATNFSTTGYGNQILIQSSANENFVARYAHLANVNVIVGQEVKQGEQIGIVGDTGNGGCHLHLVLYKNVLSKDVVTNKTYLETLVTNFNRPRYSEMSAPFVLNADKDNISAGVLWPQDFFLEDTNDNTVTGTLINPSTQHTRELEVVVTAKRMEERQGSIVAQKALQLQPNQRVNFQFKDVIKEEGTYELVSYYTMKNEYTVPSGGTKCTNDTISVKKVNVLSKSKCYTTHEPNNTKSTATTLTMSDNISIASYLSSPNNGIEDDDYFKLKPTEDGVLTFTNSDQKNKLDMILLAEDKTFTLDELIKGVLVSSNKEYVFKISSKLTSSATKCLPYGVTLGFKKVDRVISIYPNPTSGNFMLTALTPKQTYEIALYDLFGKIVYRKESVQTNSKGTLAVDTANTLAKGMYFVTVIEMGSSQKKTFKLLIK